jgi:hypothetical protein
MIAASPNASASAKVVNRARRAKKQRTPCANRETVKDKPAALSPVVGGVVGTGVQQAGPRSRRAREQLGRHIGAPGALRAQEVGNAAMVGAPLGGRERLVGSLLHERVAEQQLAIIASGPAHDHTGVLELAQRFAALMSGCASGTNDTQEITASRRYATRRLVPGAFMAREVAFEDQQVEFEAMVRPLVYSCGMTRSQWNGPNESGPGAP